MVPEHTEEENRIDGESLWDLRNNPWDPPSTKMVQLMDHLSYFYKRKKPIYRDYYEFDVDGKPQKYRKSDIYIILNELLYELRVKKEWYYDYIANHTNLTDNQNPETVKQMMKENNPHKKGKKKGISKVNVMLA